jgi:hypothetical protein
MAAVYSGLSVVGWHLMLESWWDKVPFKNPSAWPPTNSDVKLLAIFLLATIVIGSLYILFRIYCSVKKYWQVSPIIHLLVKNLPRISCSPCMT